MTQDLNLDYYDQVAEQALNEHQYTKAGRIVKDALQTAKRLGHPHPNLVHNADRLAKVYLETGDYTAAASIIRLIIDLQSETLGPEHPDVINRSRDLVSALMESGCMRPGNA
jgi:Tetratricopeptide repeat